VGGAPSELGEIAETVGSALSRSYDTTVALIVRCGTEFPGAAGVYATLVGMLSVRAPDFGAAVVRRAHAQLERTLRDPDVPPVRAPTLSPTPVNLRTGLPLALAVRFIVELAVVGVVSISSTLRFIQESVTTLTQAIEDAPAESAARGHYLDAVWYALASALFWCGDAIKSAEAGAEAGGDTAPLVNRDPETKQYALGTAGEVARSSSDVAMPGPARVHLTGGSSWACAVGNADYFQPAELRGIRSLLVLRNADSSHKVAEVPRKWRETGISGAH
jgi:hypothetical protein